MKTTSNILYGVVCASVFSVTVLALPTAEADDDEKPAAAGWLKSVRSELAKNNYDAAIKKLKAAAENKSADWHNLMGYSLRKKSPPDLAGAEKHYIAALDIDARHKGALEYYGELKLMQNDKPGAEQMLKRLVNASCGKGCEQYDDLAKEIAERQ